jgi:phospholipid/cholesterol/gamma-HCH transport system ATP-binding protein
VSADTPAVVFEHVAYAFDEQVVLRDVSFEVPRGQMKIVLGPSGSGKSLILKMILGLIRPDSGAVFVNGRRIDTMPEDELLKVRTDMGIAFQENALFDSLTVGENVGYRLTEESGMRPEDADRRIEEVLGFVGLAEYVERLPSELSGGQRRRVGIARALASEPSLILLDDPTTGLDPVIATSVDEVIVKLRDLKQVTALLVTHQIRDAFRIATHKAVENNGVAEIVKIEGGAARASATFMVLHEGVIQFEGSATEILAADDPYLKRYLYRTLPPW